jgi:hypothetical protein
MVFRTFVDVTGLAVVKACMIESVITPSLCIVAASTLPGVVINRSVGAVTRLAICDPGVIEADLGPASHNMATGALTLEMLSRCKVAGDTFSRRPGILALKMTIDAVNISMATY